MELVLIVLIVLIVLYKLGTLKSLVSVSNRLNLEAQVAEDEHKVKVAQRYEGISANVDAAKINENIKAIRDIKF